MRLSSGLFCLMLCALPMTAWGQQPSTTVEAPADKATIQYLLAEVRQLRLAIERSSSLTPRMQLAITRYQMQQERVDRVEGELKALRSMMRANATNGEMMALQMKQFESQADANEPMMRNQIELQKKAMAAQAEQEKAREQQERAQEIELSAQLQAEQGKLSELSDRLNALDRLLQQGQ